MKQGKNVKIWCGRSDLIGDTVMALPMLHYFENQYPNSYKYWSILKKCSQAAPLYFNHPLIDKIVISDHEEGFGENDANILRGCSIGINTRPEHKYQDWHNRYSMVKETWLMAGLPELEFDQLSEKRKAPKLYKWWPEYSTKKNCIAVHCFAGYGRDNHRSPSLIWWEQMVLDLIKSDKRVLRFGHPNEPDFFASGENNYKPNNPTHFHDMRNLSFMEQIQLATSCGFYIGTDSGFSLTMGAYEHPQVTLLTNWNIGHVTNPYCLAPVNGNNVNLFNPINEGGCSGIAQEKVLAFLNSLL